MREAIGLISILVICVLAGPLLSLRTTTAYTPPTGWQQYQSDAAHDGYTGSLGPTSGALIWAQSLHGSPDGIIAVGNQIIVSGPGVLLSLNGTSGANQFNYANNNDYGYFVGADTTTPASGGGLLFFYNNAGGVYGGQGTALWADYVSDGTQVWQVGVSSAQSGGAQVGGMPTYAGGVLYYAGYRTPQVSAFEATSGSQLWTVTLSDGVSGAPTLGDGVLSISFEGKASIEALNSQSGASDWNFTANAPVPASSSYANGLFYFGTTSGTVYALSSSGQLVWNEQLEGSIDSTPAVANGEVYVTSGSGTVYALNATDGFQDWNFTDSNSILASPAISVNGIMYFADSAGGVYALNAGSGSLLWSYDTGVPITASPIISNGYLYVIDTTGKVYALGTASNSTTSSSSSTSSTPPTLSSNSQSSSSSSLVTITSIATSTGTSTSSSLPSYLSSLPYTLQPGNFIGALDITVIGTMLIVGIVELFRGEQTRKLGALLITASIIYFMVAYLL